MSSFNELVVSHFEQYSQRTTAADVVALDGRSLRLSDVVAVARYELSASVFGVHAYVR